MNARNFDKLMLSQLESLEGGKLLLHCCCAPCSTACLERLKDYFKITVLFYNPNIEDAEYEKRKAEMIRLLRETGWAEIIDCDREKEKFYSAIAGAESEPEGGKRCEKCFTLRLAKTAEIADGNGFDYFSTTLTISPLKNARLINEIGESLQRRAKWLYSDFKKRDGYLRSLKLAERYGLYRQDYCGCVFSMAERDERKKL